MFEQFINKPILRKESGCVRALINNNAIEVASVCKNWNGFEHISEKLMEIRPRFIRMAIYGQII